MQDDAIFAIPTPKRAPWNKGKLIGAKPPLQQKHVWAIRTMLQAERSKRELAMFNLAIDSKLRGCDVVAIRVDNVAPNGYAIDRATVRQKKTGRPVRFELTEKHDTAPVRSTCVRLAYRHRARPSFVRHTLIAADEGDADLPPHRESARRPALAWSHQDREHSAISRH
jgi:hypothetical protein